MPVLTFPHVNILDPNCFLFLKNNLQNAPAGNQTRVSSVAGTYTITVLPALEKLSPGVSKLDGFNPLNKVLKSLQRGSNSRPFAY